MLHFGLNRMRVIALPVTAMALMLSACAGAVDTMSEMVPRASDFNVTSFDWNPYSRASMSVAPTFKRPPATAADMINADGSCAAAPAVGADGGSDQPVSSVITLQMTECAAVQSLGAPEKVEIGTNDRGERTLKLTYSHGDRTGVYYFTAGLLTQIERIAEASPPPKQKPAAKPRRAGT